MPRLTMEASHALGQEEALRRLKEKFTVAKATYQGQFKDLHEEWRENTLSFSFRAAGMKVAGTVTVEASEVKLDTQLPLPAMMFKGMIRQRVREELSRLLA